MKRLLIVLFVVFCQCHTPSFLQEKELIGEWKIDSIYNYTNGFSFMNNIPTDDWSTYQYEVDGRVAEKRYGQRKYYQYQLLPEDSLVYTDSTGVFLSGYKILKLNGQELVLKKKHKPFLSGKNQEIFEIRFFSRLTK